MKFKKLNQVNDGECWQGGVNWGYMRVCTDWNLAHAHLYNTCHGARYQRGTSSEFLY